jgi:SAM-dependent methyltransferase
VKPGEAVLDVATGPGTLALQAAAASARVSAIDFAPRMVEQLKARASAAGRDVDARVGDGMELPYADSSFDAAFSMFGLMFFPDRARGFRELRRVLAPGGRAVVSSWTRFAEESAVAGFFGAFFSDLPESGGGDAGKAPPPEPPLSTRDAVASEMSAAGFRDVVVHEVTHAFEGGSTLELFESTKRGNVAVAMVVERLRPEQRVAYERGVLERLRRQFGDGLKRVEMPAYLALGWR